MTKAVASSKWEVKEDTVDEAPRPTQMHRVLVRKVEVPVKRKVKVPVKTKAVRRVNRNRRVKVKRLVEVPAFKEVEEEYTEVKYRRVKKPKEVWVKKIVEEVVRGCVCCVPRPVELTQPTHLGDGAMSTGGRAV